MTGTLRKIGVFSGLVCILAWSGLAQNQAATEKQPDPHASAYYNFVMGHMYAEMAATYGYRSDYVDKAIGHYRAALEADPSAGYVSEELTDLYMQAGKLRDAVVEAEDMLKRNPENLEARRMLGRIYFRLIGDEQQSKINEQMVKKATEQFEKVVAKEPSDSDSWLMLGRLYKAQQDSVKAEQAYKKALETDPDNEFALSGLAQVYSDLGDSKGALELWKKLADKDPRPAALRELARAYEDSHDYKGAAETLRRAVDAAPKDPELRRRLADDLLMADQPDEALKMYTDMAKEDPRDWRLQVQLSRIYRQKHDFAKAHEAQARAAEIDPENLEIKFNEVNLLEAEGKIPESIAKMKELLDATVKKTYSPAEQANRALLLQQLGILYRTNEQYPEAVATFRRIVDVDADSAPRASLQIIETYRQAKDFQKAQQEADAAAKKFPNDRGVKEIRASVLSDLGQTDASVAIYKELISSKPDPQAYLSLAQVYEKAKRFKEEADAIDAAGRLARSDEDIRTVHFMRGAMLEKMDNLAESEKEFRKVLDMDPDNASAMNYLGYMLADRNMRLQEAHNLIVKALEIEPDNYAYMDSLGWVNFRMGRLDEAEANLRHSLERSSRDPTVHDHLGDVYLQKGRIKDAISQWETSLREWNQGAKSEMDPAEIAKVQKKLEGARVRLAKEGGVSGQSR